MNQKPILKLLERVNTILDIAEDEISVKERLEAIKLKMDIIKSLNKMGYQITDDEIEKKEEK